ncbi:MAG: dihydrodipicolinate synthase family protein [Candidatus Thorarchaeota archaeon]|jgi:4-hydroxy-tetrahydrodipicolinate synthase
MDHDKFKEVLSGFSVTTVTPFSDDLSQVDVDAISINTEFLVKNEVPLIIPNGNTGEFYSLSEDEWKTVLSASVDATRTKSMIMSGVGHSTTTAVAQLNTVRNLGVAAVMIHYPQHVFVSEEGLLGYYRTLLEAAKDLNVVLYKKGPLLTDTMLEKLMTYENLVGVKYAFGRIVDFSRTVHKLGHKIVWSCGTAERFAPFFFLAGAKAFTSGLCNFAPQVSKRMFDALKMSDFDEAMKVQKMITSIEDLREGRGVANNVPIVKAAMDHVGLKGGLCRPPIHPLSDEERNATVAVISKW